MALLQIYNVLGQHLVGLIAAFDMQAVASGPGEAGRAASAAAGAASGPAPLVSPPSRLPGAVETGGPPSAARGPPSPPMSDPGSRLAAGTPPGPVPPARVGTLILAGQSNGGAAAADHNRGQAGDVASAVHKAETPKAAARAQGAGATSSMPGTRPDLAERVEQLVGHEDAACCAVWSPSGRNAVTAAADGTRPALCHAEVTEHCLHTLRLVQVFRKVASLRLRLLYSRRCDGGRSKFFLQTYACWVRRQ